MFFTHTVVLIAILGNELFGNSRTFQGLLSQFKNFSRLYAKFKDFSILYEGQSLITNNTVI